MVGKLELKNKMAETKKKIEAIIEDIKANIDKIDEVTVVYDNDAEELSILYLDKEITIDYKYLSNKTLEMLENELFVLAANQVEKELIEYLKSKNIKIKEIDYDEDCVIIRTEGYDDILYDYYYEEEINATNYHILYTYYIFKIDKARLNEILED